MKDDLARAYAIMRKKAPVSDEDEALEDLGTEALVNSILEEEDAVDPATLEAELQLEKELSEDLLDDVDFFDEE